MTMQKNDETMKCFSNTYLAAIVANSENSIESECDKLLLNVRDGESHEAIISDNEGYTTDELSEVGHVEEITMS